MVQDLFHQQYFSIRSELIVQNPCVPRLLRISQDYVFKHKQHKEINPLVIPCNANIAMATKGKLNVMS